MTYQSFEGVIANSNVEYLRQPAAKRRFPIEIAADMQLGAEPEWLIHGLLPARGLAANYGPPGCGKFFPAIDVAMHIALGVELKPEFHDALSCFVDALELFGIGSSWGGFESLVLPSRPIRTASIWPCRPLLRLHVGLEDPDDLISDLAGAFETVGRDRQSRANRT
jgi:hypothetical protein